jgi:pimeloyl-ACP methyl ester carboxylesterase
MTVPPVRSRRIPAEYVRVLLTLVLCLFVVTSVPPQKTEIVPGDNLVVEGIPTIPASLAEAVGRYTEFRRAEYGDERDPEMRAFLDRIAPVNNAGKLKKPLFVVQGRNDPRVPPSEAEQMVSTVRKNGTPVWYLMAKDEGHGFAKKKNADFLFYATILFIHTYLLK